MKNLIATIGDTLTRMRGRLVIVLVLLVGAYFLVAFGEQTWKARQLDAEVAERQAAVNDLTAQQKSLQGQLKEYSSDQYLSYVESTARQDLNLSRPGEKVLLVRWQGAATPTSSPPPATASKPPEKPNWDKWLSLFGLH
ncbi:MAG TPA: septum formation initiator family protein [Nitrolancea sp.]|jgi:cell division protein FtsB|nr:septum formation initiator family protein [Nitrolancea sp.]